jgi:hypothetical protein
MAPRKQFRFLAELADPFGTVMGSAVLTIDEQAWIDMPIEIRRAQAKQIADTPYLLLAQPPYDPGKGQGPPFQIRLSQVG